MGRWGHDSLQGTSFSIYQHPSPARLTPANQIRVRLRGVPLPRTSDTTECPDQLFSICDLFYAATPPPIYPLIFFLIFSHQLHLPVPPCSTCPPAAPVSIGQTQIPSVKRGKDDKIDDKETSSASSPRRVAVIWLGTTSCNPNIIAQWQTIAVNQMRISKVEALPWTTLQNWAVWSQTFQPWQMHNLVMFWSLTCMFMTDVHSIRVFFNGCKMCLSFRVMKSFLENVDFSVSQISSIDDRQRLQCNLHLPLRRYV